MGEVPRKSSEERFIDSFYPAIVEDDLEAFDPEDLAERTPYSRHAVFRNMEHLLGNYNLPVNERRKDGVSYEVEDFEELEEVRDELERSIEEEIEEEDDDSYEPALEDLREEFAGETVAELELESYLAGMEDGGLDERTKHSIGTIGEITDQLADKEFVDYDSKTRNYTFAEL